MIVVIEADLPMGIFTLVIASEAKQSLFDLRMRERRRLLRRPSASSQ
jgi:hypothetical protein